MDLRQLPRLNPKNDFLFKRLFGEEAGKPLLISLLNAILRPEGRAKITNVAIVEDIHLTGEWLDDKESVLDMMCEIDEREKVNIEMQVRRFERMDYRSLFYLGKMLTDSIRLGQPYDQLKKTIGINILDHRYLPLDRYHSTFHLYEDEIRHYMLTDILELHFIECPKFRIMAFNIDDPLHRWLRFLEQSTTTEQLEELMKVDEAIKAAESRLSYLAGDEETRRKYAAREKALHDSASLLYDAEQRGIAKGIEKGIEQGMEKGIEKGIEQTAAKMLEEGLDVEMICKITGLTTDQVNQIHQ